MVLSAGDTSDAADVPLGSCGPAPLVILRASIDDTLAGLLKSGSASAVLGLMVSQIAVATPALGSRAPDRASIPPAVASAATSLIAIAAPFELMRPLVRLPSQSISNLEAVVAFSLVCWLASLAWAQQRPRWRTSLSVPWLALIAVMAVAASAAPSSRANALHMTGRIAAALAIYVMAVNGLTTAARLSRAIVTAVAAGVVVAALAILEAVQVAAVLDWLKAFRPSIAVVGAQLRAGGPLQYPTIASMYLEVVFALGLGLLVASVDRRQRAQSFALVVALVLIAEGIILTLTRAGLLSMVVTAAMVSAWRVRRHGVDAAVRAIGAVAALVAVSFAVSRPAQSVWLRLTSEGQENWYRSAIAPPDEIRFAAGETREIPIRVTNTGRVTWDSPDPSPFYFSYHWLEPTGDRVVAFEGTRTAFAAPVAPAETTTVRAIVRAPNQAGRYRIAWDIVQEGRLWFSTEPGATLTVSFATVSGSAAGIRPATTALPGPVERPGRWLLWSSAVRLAAAHPLLGVGPDNFRLLYGPYAGLRNADTRTHSNNMYLELLVGAGLLGALACGWLAWRIAAQVAAVVRSATIDEGMTVSIGVAAAVVAIGLHGLVDSFLSFTPTYILIAVTLAFAEASAPRASLLTAGTHADRV